MHVCYKADKHPQGIVRLSIVIFGDYITSYERYSLDVYKLTLCCLCCHHKYVGTTHIVRNTPNMYSFTWLYVGIS